MLDSIEILSARRLSFVFVFSDISLHHAMYSGVDSPKLMPILNLKPLLNSRDSRLWITLTKLFLLIPGVFHKRLTPKQKTSHYERFRAIYGVLCQASRLCSGLLISPHFLYYYPQPQQIINDDGVILPNALYIERPLEVSILELNMLRNLTLLLLIVFKSIESDWC